MSAHTLTQLHRSLALHLHCNPLRGKAHAGKCLCDRLSLQEFHSRGKDMFYWTLSSSHRCVKPSHMFSDLTGFIVRKGNNNTTSPFVLVSFFCMDTFSRITFWTRLPFSKEHLFTPTLFIYARTIALWFLLLSVFQIEHGCPDKTFLILLPHIAKSYWWNAMHWLFFSKFYKVLEINNHAPLRNWCFLDFCLLVIYDYETVQSCLSSEWFLLTLYLFQLCDKNLTGNEYI